MVFQSVLLQGQYNSLSIMSFKDALKLARERVYFLLEDQDGWTLSSKSNENVKIESKLSDKLNCSIYRVMCWIKAPVKVVKDTLDFLPGGRRGEWDSDIKEMTLLKQVDDATSVYVLRSNPVAKGMISAREFVNIASWEETEGSWVFVEDLSFVETHDVDMCKPLTGTGCGLESPDFEVDKSYVRADTRCSFVKIEMDPKEPGQVCVTIISEVDMKGSIPLFLLDATIPSYMVSSINTWRKFLEKEGHMQS